MCFRIALYEATVCCSRWGKSSREGRVQGNGLATRTCGEAVVVRPRGTIIIGGTAAIETMLCQGDLSYVC